MFIKNISYTPGPILCAKDIAMKEVSPCLPRAYTVVGEPECKPINT